MYSISNLIETAQELITTFGLNLIAAIVILLVGQWIAKISKQLVRRLTIKTNVDATLSSFLINISYYAVIAFSIIASLNRLGVQTASIIAILGAASLAVGLALQGSLSNFAAGVLIIVFRPFNVGDFIRLDDISGHVEKIELLTTYLITRDNKCVIVPNSTITNGNIVNYSLRGKLRFDTVIGVAYDADIDHVKRVILEELNQDPLVLKDPQPIVGVIELADSSVNFAVRPWIKPENYWQLELSIYEKIKKRLDAEGITIPFPQRDIHLFANNSDILNN